MKSSKNTSKEPRPRKKAKRFVVVSTLECQDGEMREFESYLLTENEALSLRTKMLTDGTVGPGACRVVEKKSKECGDAK